MISYAEMAQEANKLAYVYRKVYGEFPGDILQRLVDGPIITYTASTSADSSWRSAATVYGRVRWLIHLRKLCPLPARKLRKCQIRKRTKRLQRDRRRYA